jgi:hypothetical protein
MLLRVGWVCSNTQHGFKNLTVEIAFVQHNPSNPPEINAQEHFQSTVTKKKSAFFLVQTEQILYQNQ